ncbi:MULTISPECIES: CD225/dispanin family protein [unclassified Mucilaginibacter]|uniref:CD225/dispanin family protein n=1 Tax=unclassified Mucilaginibacter TaxID=2617802 RepID=UPI0031F612EA
MEQPPFSQQPFSQAPMPRPKNWLVESILVTLFCCLPLGIVGIVNAASVNSRYDAGDYNGALAASQAAGKWTKIGFGIGIVFIILYVILVFVIGIGGGLAGYR